MENKLNILFIEDGEGRKNDIKKAFPKNTNASLSFLKYDDVEKFLEEPKKGEKRLTYDEVIERTLNKINKSKAIDLIVTDTDLSGFEGMRGLSSSNVGAMCKKLGIPFCVYAFIPPKEDITTKIERLKTNDIILDIYDEKFDSACAKRVVAIAKGFKSIKNDFEKNLKKDATPIDVLAKFLEAEDQKDRFALYADGNPLLLTSQNITHTAVAIAYWFLCRVLKFPGIFANAASMSAYLDVSEKDFEDESIQMILKPVKFKGPFHELNDLWWVHKIQVILDDNFVNTFQELLDKKIKKGKNKFKENANDLYCVLSEKTVPKKEAQKGISWIPRGAILSCVSTKEFKKYSYWMM